MPLPQLIAAFLLLSPLCSAHSSVGFSPAEVDHHHHEEQYPPSCGHHHHHHHHHDDHVEIRRPKLPEELAEEEDLELYGFDQHHHHHDHDDSPDLELSTIGLWVRAMGCSLLVSMASLICLAILPLIFVKGKPSKMVVDSLALFGAGAMLGDAFLHQLPHAFGGEHSHSHEHHISHTDDHHEHGHSHSHSLQDLSVGLSILSGILLFLLVEKVVRYVEEHPGNKSLNLGHGHHHHHKTNKKLKADEDSCDSSISEIHTEKQLDGKSDSIPSGEKHTENETLLHKRVNSASTSAPHGPAVRLPAPRPPSVLRLTRLKNSSSPRRLGVSRASGSGEIDPMNGLPLNPSKVFVEEVIGAEYGEGFETFRMDGPLKVDVDYLNEKLQECFLQRIRHAMKPDEAFGLIFSWDNVVADTRSVKLDAWRQLAYEEGKDIPSDGHTQRVIIHTSADQVLQKVLAWETGESELGRLKSRLVELYYENLLKLDKPKEGLREWLDSVNTAGIPCAVISSLDRRNMLETLQRMGLDNYFQAIVTEEDGMESIAHKFLSAAVKLDRKPSKCVVFDDDPRGITAAHNCTMMAVALIGSHPAYELKQADLAIASFSKLSVINLRRLFAHKGSNFMDLQKQVIEKLPPKRKLMVDTMW